MLRDSALDALLYPFSQGVLSWAQPALFLRARLSAALQDQSYVATQPFYPEAARLQRSGIALCDEDVLPEARFPLILLLPPRQRDEARALLAKACAALSPEGVLVMAVANDEGAKSREADLKQLAGDVHTLSKYHCRVVWTRPGAAFDTALLQQWKHLDVARQVVSNDVVSGSFSSRPGVFAWDRVDAASRLLTAALPNDICGCVADLGGGWGYLSQHVLAHCPQVTSLEFYEADARALALAKCNLAHAQIPVRFHWCDVTEGIAQPVDTVVCNPPFHALAGGERPDIGRAFIAAAAAALKPRGNLWLVANRHLPYEQALATGFSQVRDVMQHGGFKIVHAVKA